MTEDTELSPAGEADAALTAVIEDAHDAAVARHAELPRDDTASDANALDRHGTDAELLAVWDRHNDPMVDPVMPETFLPEDAPMEAKLRRGYEWANMPLRSRRLEKAAADEVGEMRRNAKELGLGEPKSPADFAAIKQLMGEMPGQQDAPDIKPDSLMGRVVDHYSQTFTRNNLSPAEGVARLLDVESKLATDTGRTLREIATAYGGVSPEQVLAPEDAPAIAEWLASQGWPVAGQPVADVGGMQQRYAHDVQASSMAGTIDAWVQLRKVSNAEVSQVAQRIGQGLHGDGADVATLDAALRAVRRAKRKGNDAVDDAVTDAAIAHAL